MKFHTNYAMGLIFLITISLGMGIIVEEHQYSSVTGNAISETFNIEKVEESFNPEIASLLTTGEHTLVEDVSDNLLNKDGVFAEVYPTSIPGKLDDHFLHIDFDRKVVIISLYMKKIGDDASFELWGPTRKGGEGSLTDEFNWYTFDVSFNEMSSERYALYNYGGGDATIKIDTIKGIPKPKSGLAGYLTGLTIYNN